MDNFYKFFTSPIGLLKLTSDDYRLKSVWFTDMDEISHIRDDFPVPEILNSTVIQLNEYFEGRRFSFDLEIFPEGSLFQQKVWSLVEKVDYGETKNYGDIAKELGSNKFSRAVGMANGKNPLPIIIPCHRIIGFSGKLTGYSGGLERKKWLLVHEQKFSGNSLFI